MSTVRHSHEKAGFTLLEVMVAIAILAISLSAVFSTEAGAIRMAARARKMGNATLLARCKMGELEEKIAKEGLPAVFASGADKCCTDAEIDGYDCKWEIEPVLMPDTMFAPTNQQGTNGQAQANGTGSSTTNGTNGSSTTSTTSTTTGTPGSSTTPTQSPLAGAALGPVPAGISAAALANGAMGGGALPGQQAIVGGSAAQALINDPSKMMNGSADVGGLASMAMAMVYPMLKPSFEGQIRRATVTITWHEGGATRSFDVTQYLVSETPVVPGQQDAVDGTTPGGVPGAGGLPGAPGQAAPPGLSGGGLFGGGLIGGGSR